MQPLGDITDASGEKAETPSAEQRLLVTELFGEVFMPKEKVSNPAENSIPGFFQIVLTSSQSNLMI